MITPVKFNRYAPQVLDQLGKSGAFLTVRKGEAVNTMTIGWGSVGRVWSLPVFTILVRHNRYTYQIIKDGGTFGVSLPLDASLDRELEYCGSKSGRDVNKERECPLRLLPAQVIDSPVVGGCRLYYECEIIYSQSMALEALKQDIREQRYAKEPPHTLFYGKIVACYLGTGEVESRE